MIHVVCDVRFGTDGRLKAFSAITGVLLLDVAASNDAIAGDVFTHNGRCPAGEYELGAPQAIAPPIASEGAWQIPLIDVNGLWVAAGRGAIMIHGGGSASPEPLAPRQGFYPTEGCVRLQNEDLAHLVPLLTGSDRCTVIQ